MTSECNWQDMVRGALQDGTATDFTIRCDDRVFQVHKSILSLRSKYFNTLFTSPHANRFAGNGGNELDLTDELEELCIDPQVLEALISVIYTADYQFDYSELDPFPSDESCGWTSGTLHEFLIYHVQLSTLADCFLVPGVDDVIAEKVFRTPNLNMDYWPGGLLDEQECQCSLLGCHHTADAMSTVFQHADRHNSPHARRLIAVLLNEYPYDTPACSGVRSLMDGSSELRAEMMSDLLERPIRIKCSHCGEVERRWRPCDGEGNLLPRHILDDGLDGILQKCDQCEEVSKSQEWLMAWNESFALN